MGSEAQFFVRANEGEFRLGPHCPDGRWGHPSRTPSGDSALRWPCRLRRAIWTKSDAGAAPDPGRIRVLLRDLGVADQGVQGLWVLLAYAPNVPPDSSTTRALLSLAVAVCCRRVSACAHSTVIGREQGPFRRCRLGRSGPVGAAGLCPEGPRTPPPRARSSLWPWQYATDALLLVHTVLLQHSLEMPIVPVKCPGP